MSSNNKFNPYTGEYEERPACLPGCAGSGGKPWTAKSKYDKARSSHSPIPQTEKTGNDPASRFAIWSIIFVAILGILIAAAGVAYGHSPNYGQQFYHDYYGQFNYWGQFPESPCYPDSQFHVYPDYHWGPVYPDYVDPYLYW